MSDLASLKAKIRAAFNGVQFPGDWCLAASREGDEPDRVYHLTHGLDNTSRDKKINPRRYGERTWFDHARHKFSMLNREESAAIAGYLMYKRNTDEA